VINNITKNKGYIKIYNKKIQCRCQCRW